MKLSKLVHPELVLGLRGDPMLIYTYKKYLAAVGFELGRGYNSVSPDWKHFDQNLQEHLLVTWKFRKESAPTYYVPKDFAQAISKLDREIPVDLLPSRWFGYIAFAEDSVFDADDEVQGAYVYMGPAEETPLRPENYSKRVLWISYVCKDVATNRDQISIAQAPSGDYALINFLSLGKLLVELKPEKISTLIRSVPELDFLSDVPKTPLAVAGDRDTVYRTIINLVLYINSVDADLVRAPSTNHLSNSQRAKRREEGKPINECTVPVTLVSWNYRRPSNYSVDSTPVETHMRWQRCGPRNSQVKLIWVKEHLRFFKKAGEGKPEEE